MSKLSKYSRSGVSALPLPPKSLILLLVICLFALTATALAQEETGEHDVPESIILSQEVLPYGVQTVQRVWANQDAYIASGLPNNNYGNSTTMRMGYDTSTSPNLQAVRALIQFDLSPIPSTAQVNSASMGIFQANSFPSNDAPMGFKAQYMTAAWNQFSVTWNNANFLGGATIGIGNNTSALGWKYSDVTDLIRSWVSGAEANHGMIVTGNETPAPNNRYRWFSTTDAGYQPFVDVDYTTCTDTTKPFATISPLPQFSKGSFTVNWSGTDHGGSGISYYNIQVSQNGGSWHNWQTHTTSTSATYNGANAQSYSFRAQAVDKCGNVQDWTGAQAWTEVDSVPPQATVNPLPDFTLTSTFQVSWSGSDNPGGSGILNYDVDVRVDEGEWHSWLTGVTSTSANFTNGESLVTYDFRARATDRVGNVQPWPGSPQATTLVVLQPYSVMLPISPPVTGADSVLLKWAGATVPGTTIVAYEIYYRFNGGIWLFWDDFDGNTTEATFDFPYPNDGKYEFEVTSYNDADQFEPKLEIPEASIIVDRQPPFIVPRQIMPVIGK